jgi:hypothetical protein
MFSPTALGPRLQAVHLGRAGSFSVTHIDAAHLEGFTFSFLRKSSYDPNTAVRLEWRLGKCTLKADALPRTKPVCHGHCRFQLRCATVIAGYQLRFKQAVQ